MMETIITDKIKLKTLQNINILTISYRSDYTLVKGVW